jgi:hypothetical protein
VVHLEKMNAGLSVPEFVLWESSNIAGRPLTEPLLSDIEQASVLVADITRINFNVTYEIGYAIGLRKRLLLIKNSVVSSDEILVSKTGVFDTLGYKPYANSEDLAVMLQQVSSLIPIRIDNDVDSKAPVYLLESPVRTPEMTRIVARVKRVRLFYRSFTPSEDARLAAAGDAYESLQRADGLPTVSGSLLQRISLGDPMAENEFQNLADCYVPDG